MELHDRVSILLPMFFSYHLFIICSLCKGTRLSGWEEIVSFCSDKESKWPFCANLLSLILDIEEEKQNYEKAIEVCFFV